MHNKEPHEVQMDRMLGCERIHEVPQLHRAVEYRRIDARWVKLKTVEGKTGTEEEST